jgi:hypothetical protein
MAKQNPPFKKYANSIINANNEDMWSFKTLLRFILRFNLKAAKASFLFLI